MRGLFLMLVCGVALAQPYPTKPVRIMVGASAGGGTDIIARMLADKFADSMKQAFIVENKPGASNTIAAGQPVRWSDVAVNATEPAVRVRREMEATFRERLRSAA